MVKKRNKHFDCKNRIVTLSVITILIFLFPFRSAYCDQARASKIKAGLVFYVMKFVEWPINESHQEEKINLCLVGKDLVSEKLSNIVEGKMIQSRFSHVVEIEDLSKIVNKKCDMFYFANNTTTEQRDIVNKQISNQHSVVTMCEGKRNYSSYCMVQIFEESNKARLSINIDRPHAKNLHISSELLDLAVIVHNPRLSNIDE